MSRGINSRYFWRLLSFPFQAHRPSNNPFYKRNSTRIKSPNLSTPIHQLDKSETINNHTIRPPPGWRWKIHHECKCDMLISIAMFDYRRLMVQQNNTKTSNSPTARQRQQQQQQATTTTNKYQQATSTKSQPPFTTPHHPYSQGNTKANCAASLLSSHSNGGTNGISLSLRSLCLFSAGKIVEGFFWRGKTFGNFEKKTE